MPKRDRATAFAPRVKKKLVPFWNDRFVEWSDRLWKCAHDDSVATPPASWDQNLSSLGRNSWFAVRQTIPLAKSSCTKALPKCMWISLSGPMTAGPMTSDGTETEVAPKASIGGLRKIRIYPTKNQQTTINVCLGAVRWTYNRAVAYINDEGSTGKRSIKDLRAFCVNDDIIKVSKRSSWAGSIPYDIRDEGVRDAQKAVGSNMAKQRIRRANGFAFSFKLRYRRKKYAFQETMVLHSKHWQKTRGFYHDLIGCSGSKLRAAEKLPDKLDYDIRLIRTRLNQYFLCIPTGSVAVPDENQVMDDPSTVALDPGVRTFMTAYAASGQVVEWGRGDTTRIHRLCHAIDSLESRYDTVNHRLRYRLRRAALRIRRKIRRLVDELHYKLIQWLLRSFKAILIPLFETQQMIKRKNGHMRLSSQTAKAMCTWSHFRFRTNLKNKAKSFPGVCVIETTEEFTSKTCGQCGKINAKLGSSKTFSCGACDFRSDRDFNGARNIMIRHLTVTRVDL